MRKEKKAQAAQAAEEAMVRLADELAMQEYSEYAHLFEEDEQFLENRQLVENVSYEDPSEGSAAETAGSFEVRKKKKRKHSLAKLTAIAAVVCLVFTAAVPEASAWRIWGLDFLFVEHSDHTEITPNDDNTFPQYYVADIPEGFEIEFESTMKTISNVRYINKENQFILYTQVQREQFVSLLDNENRGIEKAIIGDFNVIVSKTDKDIIIEAVTDEVAITVQTNAGYETGKKFMESLKEI